MTVFDGHEMLCEHPRMTGRKGQYSTLPEHVPPQHCNIDGLWPRQRFAYVTVIEAQGHLACQNILDGVGKNNRERLDAACQELLNRRAHPT
ncbi:hypothetical protein K2F54_10905 [Cryobacterium sp. 1639]|uniref:hypothetical protein n=1 Tax=Cryobacterium inferilacus TaxID=2866629 RepID=UPI001C733257|nr:hypothetical protein [Cryobacterium sp. 1639]MBX0300485.1 hypothetical protein [Cryobacterium sp. 1639]